MILLSAVTLQMISALLNIVWELALKSLKNGSVEAAVD